jgi:hypothetical protein
LPLVPSLKLVEAAVPRVVAEVPPAAPALVP